MIQSEFQLRCSGSQIRERVSSTEISWLSPAPQQGTLRSPFGKAREAARGLEKGFGLLGVALLHFQLGALNDHKKFYRFLSGF